MIIIIFYDIIYSRLYCFLPHYERNKKREQNYTQKKIQRRKNGAKQGKNEKTKKEQKETGKFSLTFTSTGRVAPRKKNPSQAGKKVFHVFFSSRTQSLIHKKHKTLLKSTQKKFF